MLILDEAQALRLSVLAPAVDVLRILVEQHGLTLVISTAMQPAWRKSIHLPQRAATVDNQSGVPAANLKFEIQIVCWKTQRWMDGPGTDDALGCGNKKLPVAAKALPNNKVSLSIPRARLRGPITLTSYKIISVHLVVTDTRNGALLGVGGRRCPSNQNWRIPSPSFALQRSRENLSVNRDFQDCLTGPAVLGPSKPGPWTEDEPDHGPDPWVND